MRPPQLLALESRPGLAGYGPKGPPRGHGDFPSLFFFVQFIPCRLSLLGRVDELGWGRWKSPDCEDNIMRTGADGMDSDGKRAKTCRRLVGATGLTPNGHKTPPTRRLLGSRGSEPPPRFPIGKRRGMTSCHAGSSLVSAARNRDWPFPVRVHARGLGDVPFHGRVASRPAMSLKTRASGRHTDTGRLDDSWLLLYLH